MSILDRIATAIEAQRRVRESAPVTTYKKIDATILTLAAAHTEIVTLRRRAELAENMPAWVFMWRKVTGVVK